MNTIIKTDHFTLRPFAPEDALTLSVRINTKSIDEYTTIELPWSIDFSSWWINFIAEQLKKNPLPEIHWVIEVDGELAGAVGLINIEDHKGEMGYWLEERFWSKGLMTEVVARVTNFGLKNLKLKRIFAPVLPFNKGSMRVLEKNNYVLEGVLKNHFNKKGRLWDAHMYAVTA